ncbi:Phosphoglycerate kinase [Candidatus Fokinia solitaria]|uniref:Phosphoglycerate kinase n=1 Tax=Candidatus Fokinia solitaria TaxID=1802984 RepID=A0A2U8BSH2_9RICK|nr:phosphoglycerate kinase [Candidatus Fokinia solitaria]AWD33292.1 Phosphoglycerate kinase [Candidatus Fokinia solitaria]
MKIFENLQNLQNFQDSFRKKITKNRAVLIRVDFNMPTDQNGNITSFQRLEKAQETINFVLKCSGIPILLAHLGEKGAKFSAYIEQINAYLRNRGFHTIHLVSDESCFTSMIKALQRLLSATEETEGKVFLIENIRLYSEEKENSHKAAQMLISEISEFYINEAFSCCHRSHMSMSALPMHTIHKFCGIRFMQELKAILPLTKTNFDDTTVILGGAKISTKLPLIKFMTGKVKNIIVSGGIANTILKYGLNYNISSSLIEIDAKSDVDNLMYDKKCKIISIDSYEKDSQMTQILLPSDFRISEDVRKESEALQLKIQELNTTKHSFSICDIGNATVLAMNNILQEQKIVIWNGPLGVYEDKRFKQGTDRTLQMLSKFTKNGVIKSFIGGGDTIACIENQSEVNITHISDGGGSFIALLSGDSLPGLNSMLSTNSHLK